MIYGRNDAHPSLSAQRQHQIIHGQFTIVICLVPPSCERDQVFLPLALARRRRRRRWLRNSTTGERVRSGGSPNSTGRIVK